MRSVLTLGTSQLKQFFKLHVRVQTPLRQQVFVQHAAHGALIHNCSTAPGEQGEVLLACQLPLGSDTT